MLGGIYSLYSIIILLRNDECTGEVVSSVSAHVFDNEFT